jgi:hypothetical protein
MPMNQRQRINEATLRVTVIRGALDSARRWTRKPNPWLNGGTPIEMLKTPERRATLDTYLARVANDGGQNC